MAIKDEDDVVGGYGLRVLVMRFGVKGIHDADEFERNATTLLNSGYHMVDRVKYLERRNLIVGMFIKEPDESEKIVHANTDKQSQAYRRSRGYGKPCTESASFDSVVRWAGKKDVETVKKQRRRIFWKKENRELKH